MGVWIDRWVVIKVGCGVVKASNEMMLKVLVLVT